MVQKLRKILIKYSEFRYAEANSNNITWYKVNINSQINVTFYYLSNETENKTRYVAVTVLELKPKHLNQQS